MRLIHLAAYGGAYPGSFIPMVRAILESAQRRGWATEAVFSGVADECLWTHELQRAEIACRIVPNGRSARARAVRELTHGDSHGPIVLHTHFANFDMSALAAKRRRDDVLVYLHKHGELCTTGRSRLRNTVKLGLFGRGAEEILCVAPNVLEDARTCLAPHARLTHLPNAIDVARFPRATPEARQRARAKLALPADAKVILHFGWDWQLKGGDVLLEAVADLVRNERVRDLVALTVADETVVRPAAQSCGVAEHVRALAPTDDVQALYAAADVFVAPSGSEGHPFAVAEALASGLPVIASPIAGHEVMAAAMQGCHIAERNAAAFADAIVAVLGQPSGAREAAGTADRARLATEMDVRPWSERMIERYEGALQRRSLL